jgi:hypothetical protein
MDSLRLCTCPRPVGPETRLQCNDRHAPCLRRVNPKGPLSTVRVLPPFAEERWNRGVAIAATHGRQSGLDKSRVTPSLELNPAWVRFAEAFFFLPSLESSPCMTSIIAAHTCGLGSTNRAQCICTPRHDQPRSPMGDHNPCSQSWAQKRRTHN